MSSNDFRNINRKYKFVVGYVIYFFLVGGLKWGDNGGFRYGISIKGQGDKDFSVGSIKVVIKEFVFGRELNKDIDEIVNDID